MDEAAIRALLDSILAPWVRELSLAPEAIGDDGVTLRLPYSEHLRHAGGVICGQVFMAAADTAMVVAISHVMGAFSPMTTVSLNTTFMRPVKAGDVLVTARVMRRGRNLVFGEIDMHDDRGELAAHATTTYALINKDQ
ncbi:Phenylacetic acid degradation-related protein [Burkholderia sp. 8Y]|uniref:PaaI family thioesterase n=1 Tax=Burkholderia sp. 8Y TaxID=2653133 RepID=UPI0012EF1F38|nr:PaaI family thioesterase [Burkholderia sp. 8Y]VXC61348.1 Phenylacetic acid degradation-related protein [Burkholderia sp. 8Y]